MRKKLYAGLALLLLLGMAITPLMAAAEGDTATTATGTVKVSHASEIAAHMGVLLGDGQGVTEQYLAKTTTRVQGAIITLRLLGKEKEALAYQGTDNFADASSVGKSLRPVLAYLKNHPELGWLGTGGGKFSPTVSITAQQVYKVMLESLSYRTGADFNYADTIAFAKTTGLQRAAAASPFTNRDLAEALLETLQTMPKGGMDLLVDGLVKSGVVAADKAALLGGARIDLHQTAGGSTYFTDGKGMSLYLFTKDMADLNSCTGDCPKAWPVFGSDRLLIANSLDAKDFGSFVRNDGVTQITYKGWPLYYFSNDLKPGDVSGEGKGKVWYLIKQPFYSVAVGTDPNLKINYLVDAQGMSLYYFDKDPMGASVCSGDCLVKWPLFHTDKPIVPSGLKAEDFGEIVRPDGAKQTTFKGYPLYHWYQDAKRGDIKGHELGKVWFLVDPEKFTGTTTEQSLAGKVTIEMKNYAFSTPDITVKAGTTITFKNMDDDWHNVVAADGTVLIAKVNPGESVTIKLDKPGILEYHCQPHQEHMKGKITIQ